MGDPFRISLYIVKPKDYLGRVISYSIAFLPGSGVTFTNNVPLRNRLLRSMPVAAALTKLDFALRISARLGATHAFVSSPLCSRAFSTPAQIAPSSGADPA